MTEDKEKVEVQQEIKEEKFEPKQTKEVAKDGTVTINLYELYEKQAAQIDNLNKQIASLLSKPSEPSKVSDEDIELKI